MTEFKTVLRSKFGKLYRHELLNNLFFHPYTKVEFLEKELMVSRVTANRYLSSLLETHLIDRVKIGKAYYYINIPLMNLFMSVSDNNTSESVPSIESVQQ
jgi:Fic family protein